MVKDIKDRIDGLGPAPGQAQGDADPPVHRHGDRAELAASNQSTWLAGQINSLPSYRLTRPLAPHPFPTLQENPR